MIKHNINSCYNTTLEIENCKKNVVVKMDLLRAVG